MEQLFSLDANGTLPTSCGANYRLGRLSGGRIVRSCQHWRKFCAVSNPYQLSVSLSTPDEPAAPQTVAPAMTCFAVQAVAEPGLISRVLEHFAKRGLMPTKLIANYDCEAGSLDIDIQVPDLTLQEGEKIACSLRVIVGVCLVLTSEKHRQRELRL